jgi:hypothetical protein
MGSGLTTHHAICVGIVFVLDTKFELNEVVLKMLRHVFECKNIDFSK